MGTNLQETADMDMFVFTEEILNVTNYICINFYILYICELS